ncbi:MAG: DUF3473 domain-containing protein [Desulfobacteraceae bacterium]|nr:DUF3473 domain-containing protein [Desulfobacteraceae bacterium]
MKSSSKILITVDVEDWYQVENLRPWFPPEKWPELISRVEKNTLKLLDLFDSFSKKISATFFVLGQLAEKKTDLIRQIKNKGHEVASHGYSHRLCNEMRYEDLKADLIKSKDLLENILGENIYGYRAPSFSINNQILDLIKECGYRYDSSYNSFDKHGRYGAICIDKYRLNGIAMALDDDFYELPISNLQIAGQIIPWGGGGYFRLLPFGVFKRGITRILNLKQAYLFYIHPWEIDPGQPKIKSAKGLSVWRHYINLEKTYGRLSTMISRFSDSEFLTCSQYLGI